MTDSQTTRYEIRYADTTVRASLADMENAAIGVACASVGHVACTSVGKTSTHAEYVKRSTLQYNLHQMTETRGPRRIRLDRTDVTTLVTGLRIMANRFGYHDAERAAAANEFADRIADRTGIAA